MEDNERGRDIAWVAHFLVPCTGPAARRQTAQQTMMHAVAIVREGGLERVWRLVAGCAATLQAHAQAQAVRSVSLPCDASRARVL